MAQPTGADGKKDEVNPAGRSGYDLPWVATARTAPRASHESRIGTDEAHERLQEARNRRKSFDSSPDLPSERRS